MEGLCVVNNVKKYFCSRIEVGGDVFFTSINGSDNFTFEPWMTDESGDDEGVSLVLPLALSITTLVGFCVILAVCAFKE